MRNPLFMNQAYTTVIGDGVPWIDFMDGDAIRIIENTEGSALEVGFDGARTLLTTNNTGTAEFDFKPTSPTLDILNRLQAMQKTAAGRLFNVQLTTSALEPIRLEGCSIASMGTSATGARTVSARTVTLNVQSIIKA